MPDLPQELGEFFSNQIEYAGAVILSRTDKAKPEKIEEGVALLRELNDKAPFITTPISELSGQKSAGNDGVRQIPGGRTP